MRRAVILASGLVVSVCVAQSIGAQVSMLERGSRVRITFVPKSAKPLVGVLQSFTDDSLLVRGRVDNRMLISAIPRTLIGRVEVSRGRHRPAWSLTAPLWMAASGAGVGVLVGSAVVPKDDFWGPSFGATVYGAIGGFYGLLAGTGLAIRVHVDNWVPIPEAAPNARSASPPSIYLAPAAGGLRAGLRASF